MRIENRIIELILKAAFSVHADLGPGLLESAYEECLYHELISLGLTVSKQKPMPLIYKKVQLEVGYRMDLLVEKRVIVEVKSVNAFNEVHMAEVITYLKLSGCKMGLLLNFNLKSLKNGIRRVLHTRKSVQNSLNSVVK